MKEPDELSGRDDEWLNRLKLLENLKKEWEQTVDCLGDIVILTGPDGLIVRFNKILSVLSGKPFQNLIGKKWLQVLLEEGFSQELDSPTGMEFFHHSGKWFNCTCYPLHDVPTIGGHGTVVALKDITEIRQAQVALKESEARFRVLAQHAPCGIVILRNGLFHYANPFFEAITGHSARDLLNMRFQDIVHPDQTDSILPVLFQETDSSLPRFTCRIVTGSGSSRWLDVSGIAVEMDGMPSLLVTAFDITVAVEAQQTLRRSEERYRTLIETSPDIILVCNRDLRIVMANGQASRSYGYGSADEMVGLSFVEHLSPKDVARFREHIESLARTSCPEYEEFDTLRRDLVNPLPVELRASPVGDGSILLVCRDVSEQRKIREEIEWLASFTRLNPNSCIEADMTAKLTYTNPATETLIPGLKAEGFDHPYLTDLKKEVESLRSGTRTSITREVRVGEAYFLQTVHYVPELERMRIYGHNITLRKKMELALRESEQKYRTIFENAVEGIFRTTPNGSYLSVNPSLARMIGFDKPEDMIAAYTDIGEQQYVVPGDRLKFKSILKSAGQVDNFETMILRRDGERIWISINARLVADEAGKPLYEGTAENITDRKLAELSLRAEKEKFQTFSEHAVFGIAMIDRAGRYLYVNRKFTKIFGYTLENIPDGRRWFRKAFPIEKDRENAIKAWLQDVETLLPGEEYSRTFEIVDRNGTVKIIDISVVLPVGGLPDSGYYLMFYEDITLRKRAESKLIESQERYRTAIEHSIDGVTLVSNLQHVYVNRKFLEIFGYTEPDEILGTPVSAILHQDSRDWVINIARNRIEGKPVPDRYEAKCVRKDGTTIYVEVSAAAIRYGGEKVILAYIRDVTEKKKSEEKLEEHRKMLEVKNRELEKANSELKLAHSQILQQEKMASIGQLAAGVAHEINNPVGFVSSNLTCLRKYAGKLRLFLETQADATAKLAEGPGNTTDILTAVNSAKEELRIDHVLADLDNLIAESLDGVERVKRIVQDLKSFSRIDESEHKLADINEGLESTINIVWN